MSSPVTFNLFPQLLPEIRLQIWEHALQPRIITFSCSLFNFNVRKAPQALYLVGGDAPYYQHFTMNVPQRPTSPYYIVQCYPRDVASAPLLSTCHESRDVALRHGYKAWRIESESLGTRELMWNPKLDVIHLAIRQDNLPVDEPSLDIFTTLFPEQTREIQRLVVESEHFLLGCWGQTGRHDCEWARVLDFRDLIELVSIIDPYSEWRHDWDFEHGRYIEAAGETSEQKSKTRLQMLAVDVGICLSIAKEQRLGRMKTGCEEHTRLTHWLPAERIRVVGSKDHVLK